MLSHSIRRAAVQRSGGGLLPNPPHEFEAGDDHALAAPAHRPQSACPPDDVVQAELAAEATAAAEREAAVCEAQCIAARADELQALCELGADPIGCRGIHVPGHTACLAHVADADRDAYLD